MSAKPDVELSDRELQIAYLCAEGLSNDEIALHLGLSIDTVKVHVKSLISKTGLKSRASFWKIFKPAMKKAEFSEIPNKIANHKKLISEVLS